MQESAAWYDTGRFTYKKNRNEFEARDSTRAMAFTCGLVELIAKLGVSASAADSLVASCLALLKEHFEGH